MTLSALPMSALTVAETSCIGSHVRAAIGMSTASASSSRGFVAPRFSKSDHEVSKTDGAAESILEAVSAQAL